MILGTRGGNTRDEVRSAFAADCLSCPRKATTFGRCANTCAAVMQPQQLTEEGGGTRECCWVWAALDPCIGLVLAASAAQRWQQGRSWQRNGATGELFVKQAGLSRELCVLALALPPSSISWGQCCCCLVTYTASQCDLATATDQVAEF